MRSLDEEGVLEGFRPSTGAWAVSGTFVPKTGECGTGISKVHSRANDVGESWQTRA